MKKWIWISLTAAGLAAAVGFGIHGYRQAQAKRLELEANLAKAEEIHEDLHDRYLTALDALAQSRLTVTEDGRTVGTYTLEDLGLAETAETEITEAFGETDRLEAEDFAALAQAEKLEVLSRADFEPESPSLLLNDADFSQILKDLNAAPRRRPVDCRPYFAERGFAFKLEIPGTVLDEARVVDALRESLEGRTLTQEPLELSLELTDCDPYLPPAVTVENQNFDLNELLQTILHNRNYSLHVDVWGTTRTLGTQECAALLQVDKDGRLQMDREKAAAQIAAWAEAADADYVPYYFASLSAGKVFIPFLRVNCRLNQDAMLDRMEDALCRLSNDTVDAPFDCTDWAGRPVDLSDTYIEVDIARQTMSAFHNGELVVSTPVVSGRPSGHMTPPGYYHVLTKNGERWLTGPDYSVYVHYWLGFYDAYGIHDAMWRSEFGGQRYLTNGSHGCVNTPTEAMEKIWNTFEIGTPVLVFNEP